MATTRQVQGSETTILIPPTTSDEIRQDTNMRVKVAIIAGLCIFGTTSLGLIIAGEATNSPTLKGLGYGIGASTLVCLHQWVRHQIFPDNISFY